MLSDALVIAAVAALCAGVLLFVFGWRGRRLNDDPVCRKCRFNLSGSPAVPDRCPECGRGLDGWRTVRRGERRRRVWLAVVGVVLAVAGGGGVGVSVYQDRSGGSLDSIKPEWWLTLDAQSTSEVRSERAMKELSTRLNDGRLSESGCRSLAELILQRWSDLDGPWNRRWVGMLKTLAHEHGLGSMMVPVFASTAREVLERQHQVTRRWNEAWGWRVDFAFRLGLLDRSIFDDYLRQSARFAADVTIPERIYGDVPWCLHVRAAPARSSAVTKDVMGTLGPLRLSHTIRSITVDGADVTDEATGHLESSQFSAFEAAAPRLVQMPPIHGFGVRDVVVAVDWVMSRRSYVDGWHTDEDDLIEEWSATYRVPVEVVDDSVVLGVKLENEEHARALVENLTFLPFARPVTNDPVPVSAKVEPGMWGVELPSGPRSKHWRVTCEIKGFRIRPELPQMAYRIFAVDGDRSMVVGEYSHRGTLHAKRGLVVRWPVDSWVAALDAVNLEFRPDPMLAQAAGCEWYLGDTLHVKGVQLEESGAEFIEWEPLLKQCQESLEVTPKVFALDDQFTAFQFEVKVHDLLPGWKALARLEAAGRTFQMESIQLAPARSPGHRSAVWTTHLTYRLETSGLAGDFHGPVMLHIGFTRTITPQHEFTIGPIEIDHLIRDSRSDETKGGS